MKYNLVYFVFVLLLAACQPAATPQPSSGPPIAVLPTELPKSTSTPAPVESLAASVDDLIGVWWFPQGPIFVELKEDGTYRVWDNYSGTQAEGNYTYEAGRITWGTSQPACKEQPATYEVFLTRQGEKVTHLRLQVVGSDPCSVRVDNVKGIAKPYTP